MEQIHKNSRIFIKALMIKLEVVWSLRIEGLSCDPATLIFCLMVTYKPIIY